MAELKLAEMEKRLVPWDEFAKLTSTRAMAVRQGLDALLAGAAHLCNPADPEHARMALDQWLAMSLPIIQVETDMLPAADTLPK